MSKVLTDQIEKRTGGTAMDLPATGKWPTANIADDAVTLAKQAAGTQGGIVYYGAAGAPTELAVGTAGQALLSGGASANLSWGSAGVSTIAALTDETVSASDPTISTNPAAVGYLWINSTSGNQYICTNITAGANVWTNVGIGTTNIETLYNVDFLIIAGGGCCGDGYNGRGGGGGAGQAIEQHRNSGVASGQDGAGDGCEFASAKPPQCF